MKGAYRPDLGELQDDERYYTMKDYEIRIAIARECGWLACRYVEGIRDVRGVPPNGWRGDLIHFSNEAWVPLYISDLNAMHEVEKTLIADEKIQYYRALCPNEMEWLDHNAWGILCFATAAQRAEAYLRAKGLWKDQ